MFLLLENNSMKKVFSNLKGSIFIEDFCEENKIDMQMVDVLYYDINRMDIPKKPQLDENNKLILGDKKIDPVVFVDKGQIKQPC